MADNQVIKGRCKRVTHYDEPDTREGNNELKVERNNKMAEN